MEQGRKKKRGLAALLYTLAALLVLAGLLLALDGRQPRVTLRGGAEMELALGTAYEEPGAEAVSVGSVFGPGRSLAVTVSGAVDPDTLGDYTLSYTADWAGREGSAQRLVHVVDRTAPVIELERREGYSLTWFERYEEEGYSASDNIDGDLTAQVVRTVYDDHVDYEVSDAAGNSMRITRPLPFTVGKPIITLSAGESMQIPAAMAYEDPGFTVADEQGHDLSEYVSIEGAVQPDLCGRYQRSYTIDSGHGFTVTATRTVEVVPAARPETVTPTEKTIYLTFDDGPGPYTAQLLDILADCGVQATFFVTGKQRQYADCIGRAYREGHAVGVHSYTHDYDGIYASEEAYYADFLACEELICEQTGAHTTLFRFPGGSSNTVSQFNAGIMGRLTQRMTDMGYQYFDWNVDSDDALRAWSAEKVYQNVIAGCEGKEVCLVLQHDVKPQTVQAMRRIIAWGQENGYSFRALDSTSPTFHHPVAN